MSYRFKARSATPGAYNFVAGSLGFAPAVGSVLESAHIGDGTAGTYHDPEVSEVQKNAAFGVSPQVGTYDPITGNYTDPGKANVAEGNDYTFAGVLQTAAYPLTADSQAAQLATDQAAVLAAAASILDSATILSQAGTYHAPEASEVWNTAVFGASSATAGTMGPTDIVVGEGTLAASDIKDGVILDPDGEPLEGTFEGAGGGGGPLVGASALISG